MPPSKARAVKRSKARRKKVTGFRGVQKQFVDDDSRETTAIPSVVVRVGPNPNTSSPMRQQQSEAMEQPHSSRHLAASFRKLDATNCILQQDEVEEVEEVEDEEVDEGFQNSIINLALIQLAITASAICKSCKDPNSQLILNNNKRKRCGLAENLSIECSVCNNVTELQTSRWKRWRIFLYQQKIRLDLQCHQRRKGSTCNILCSYGPPISSDRQVIFFSS